MKERIISLFVLIAILCLQQAQSLRISNRDNQTSEYSDELLRIKHANELAEKAAQVEEKRVLKTIKSRFLNKKNQERFDA